MGTALNKILKDVVNRSQQMLGKDAVYVPGWDCHGLPIEWQIEQRYRQAGKDKDAVPIAEFRRECREFAEHWIDVQRSEFKRLGVVGDWDHPYTTMEHEAEAGIYRELGKFLLSGQLYRGKKSVMWSVVEKTALAEAEVEYRDHTSTTIVVRFPVVEPAHPALAGASVLIWTTTPWTMPGNRAVAYGEDIEYRVIEVTAVAEGSLARVGERLVLAARLVDQVAEQARISGHRTVADLTGRDLAGTGLRHPLHGKGYDFAVPLLAGDFVSAEEGTGFVHVAPSHGADDFELGARHGLEVPDAVAEDGHYTDAVPLFAGIARVRGGRAGDRGARRARRPARPRQAGAQLSPFLALQGAADLPRDPPVVHPDGRGRTAAREGARRDRGHPLGAAPGQESHPRHG